MCECVCVRVYSCHVVAVDLVVKLICGLGGSTKTEATIVEYPLQFDVI